MKVFILLSIVAVAYAQIRPEDALAQHQQQLELARLIAENNRLNGVSQALSPLSVPSPTFSGVREDERLAFERMQQDLAGLILQQRALEQSVNPSGPVANDPINSIFSNLPIANVNNPADTAAQRRQIEELAGLIQAQRAQFSGASSQSFGGAQSFGQSFSSGQSFGGAQPFAQSFGQFSSASQFPVQQTRTASADDGQYHPELFEAPYDTQGTRSGLESNVVDQQGQSFQGSFPGASSFGSEFRSADQQHFQPSITVTGQVSDRDLIALAEQQRQLNELISKNEALHGAARFDQGQQQFVNPGQVFPSLNVGGGF